VRIVGGTYGGRRLAVPSGHATRPTADRTREALFSTLTALRETLAGARVLDLYAGSGAVGLEALSRGAAEVLLVESDRSVVGVLRDNVAALGVEGARVAATTVERLVADPPAVSTSGAPYDVAFLDPPYAYSMATLTRVLTHLRRNRWLADGAIVVVERGSRDGNFSWPAGFEAERSRRYGEGTLWYGRAAMETAGAGGGTA
jgi:16S rRNA (guanine966-N2)-methyltransferase